MGAYRLVPMPEVHAYVSAPDKALIEALPPQVTVASILREALAGRRACPHERLALRCASCGAAVEGHPGSAGAGTPGDAEAALDVERPVEVDIA